jgi:hypothetical protein
MNEVYNQNYIAKPNVISSRARPATPTPAMAGGDVHS